MQLEVFLTENRADLIERCAVKVAARRTPKSTDSDIARGVPLFLDRLIETLRRDAGANDVPSGDAAAYGRTLMDDGFTVAQVVHTYGDVCQSVTDLAVECQAPITTEDFRVLNRCLDDAIADAVTAFSHARDDKMAAGHSGGGSQRFGMLAHEVRNLLTSATLTFEVLKTGSVGVSGATGMMLEKLLSRLGALVDRSIAEARLEDENVQQVPFEVRHLFEEIEAAMGPAAKAKGLSLSVVLPSPADLAVDVDPHILQSIVFNLVQNAIKFTHADSSVTLSARHEGARVLIDVADECGGLPPGGADALFQPFAQRSADRSGLGLGLGIARRGAEANGGTLEVRDIPTKGCVFTLDLAAAK